MSGRRRSTRKIATATKSTIEIPDDDDMLEDLMEEATDEEEQHEQMPPAQSSISKKHEEQEHTQDKSLIEFLDQMDNYKPMIPEAALDHYLMKAGFDCPDDRIKRLIGLVAQKFVSDVAQDAYQYSKLRQQSMSSRDKKAANSKKTVLAMDDLSAALAEYGVNSRKPDFYT